MCFVAVEDELSEVVALKLLEGKLNLAPQVMGKKLKGHLTGNAYLKNNVKKFCSIAQNGGKILIITDLDSTVCAPELIKDWFGTTLTPDKMLFRVVVRSIEAWIMADKFVFAQFLGIDVVNIQNSVEHYPRPKQHLLQIAEKAKDREVREAVVAKKGTLSIQGLGYNECLSKFINNHWCPIRASENSPSLKKAITRLETWSLL